MSAGCKGNTTADEAHKRAFGDRRRAVGRMGGFDDSIARLSNRAALLSGNL